MKINLRESLNKLDLQTENKYDLLTTYDCSKISKKQKKLLAEELSKEKVNESRVYKILKEEDLEDTQLYKIVCKSGPSEWVFESSISFDDAEEIAEYYDYRWIDENGFEWDMIIDEDDEATERLDPFALDEAYNEDPYIRLLDRDSQEYENLDKVAGYLMMYSPNHIHYHPENTYFDYGQNWKWTTIIARRNNGDSWQALNPRQQKNILLCTTDEELEEVAKDILRESRLDKGFNESLKEAINEGHWENESWNENGDFYTLLTYHIDGVDNIHGAITTGQIGSHVFDKCYIYVNDSIKKSKTGFESRTESKKWVEDTINKMLKKNESLIEGLDLSDVPEVKELPFVNNRVNMLRGIFSVKDLVNALNRKGLNKFKIRTSRLKNISNGDIKDAWYDLKKNGWSVSIKYDDSLSGFNEVYVFEKITNESLTENIDFYEILNNYNEELVGNEVDGYVFKDQKSAAKFTKYLDHEAIDYFVEDSSEEDKKYYGKDYLYKVVVYNDYDEYIDESLTEASYGGAYDIEDYMFFTKEELLEFSDNICDALADTFGYSYNIDDLYMMSPKQLYISIEDIHDIVVESTFMIDMRKIRRPSDLSRVYGPIATNWFKKAFSREYKESWFDESLNENVYYPNGEIVPEDSVDMDKFLDYNFGTDRDKDNSHFTTEEKQRSVNYWFKIHEPSPYYESLTEDWAHEKYDKLMDKDKKNWDEDDWDAYNYIMQVWGESGYFDESLNEDLSDLDLFLNTPVDTKQFNEETFRALKNLVSEYKRDLDNLDQWASESEKEPFVKKWYKLADKCKEIVKNGIRGITGYGRLNDFIKLKVVDLARSVDNTFPWYTRNNLAKFNRLESLEEKLNNREKNVFINEIEKTKSLAEIENIIKDIRVYDLKLYSKLVHYPNDFEKAKSYILKILKNSLEESLTEDMSPSSLYLYHATDSNNVESILKKGLLINPGHHNWEGMYTDDAIFLAFDANVAEDYAYESNSEPEEVTVLKVKLNDLDSNYIGYDWNNRCEYHDDINSCAYYKNIPGNLLKVCDPSFEPSYSFDDFEGTELYDILYDTFDTEVETNLENGDFLSSDYLQEDTVKQNGKWVNKGSEGTHGKFRTKKAADAQRKAMFANGYKAECLDEQINLPGYAVKYVSGYLGNGVNDYRTEWFRTEEERDRRAAELESKGYLGIKTWTMDNFYHTLPKEECLEESNGNTEEKVCVFTKDKYDGKTYYHGWMTKEEANKHYPDRLKEAIEDEIDFEEINEDSNEVEEGNNFFEDGKEWTWEERIAGPIYLDFDKWSVWKAKAAVDIIDFIIGKNNHGGYDFDEEAFYKAYEDSPIVYFVVEEDTGFIDWGPVENEVEAKDFLNSKQDDWDNDQYYGESLQENKTLQEYFDLDLEYDDIDGESTPYTFSVNYDDVLEYLKDTVDDHPESIEDLPDEEFQSWFTSKDHDEWIEDNFEELFDKYKDNILDLYREDAEESYFGEYGDMYKKDHETGTWYKDRNHRTIDPDYEYERYRDGD